METHEETERADGVMLEATIRTMKATERIAFWVSTWSLLMLIGIVLVVVAVIVQAANG